MKDETNNDQLQEKDNLLNDTFAECFAKTKRDLYEQLNQFFNIKSDDDLEQSADDIEDPVNHPSHYETGKYECIDVMIETQGKEAVISFCICNAFKYLYRHNNKNGVEDLKKAIWYLNKSVELMEG